MSYGPEETPPVAILSLHFLPDFVSILLMFFQSVCEDYMKVRGSVKRGLLLLAMLMMSATGYAQDGLFGKNKVQYTKFNWYFIQTDHFDIYFSDGGEKIAEFAASAAESAYASIRKTFRYQLTNRVPIIVANSHNDFQQNNVVSVYLEEGVGGVTELFKNRVLIPFEGNYKQFRHVIHHELVHAVINDMFYGGSIQSIIANNITLQLPLWLNEGLSEYEAQRWETDSDMFLRDATVHNYLPPINRLSGYFAYRGGQALWWYISNKYGEQKIGDILNRIKSTRNVEAGFRGALGLSLEELNERWQKEMKVLYWPDIARREEPTDYARRLTDHKKDGNFYNTSPALSPQGDRLAFISDRKDYFDVFVMNTIDGKDIDKVVSGQTTNDFEELKLLTPRLTWSPDGKMIALAAKAGAQDAILMIDVESGRSEKLTFDLNAIYSVDWSPQGNKLAFVGNKFERSDIYSYDIDSKKLTALTRDVFSDSDPTWSHDGKFVYFSSDRQDYIRGESVDMATFDYSHRNLYRVNTETLEIEQLTDWPNSNESSVVVSADGKKILFVSDKNGISNIYEMVLETRATRPITNSLTGVYQLSLSRDGSKLAFASLHHAGFDLFLMRNPFERELKVGELELTEFFKAKLAEPSVQEMKDSVAVATAPADSAGLYGKDIEIDFSGFAGDILPDNVPSDSTIVSRLPRIAGNIDSEGRYKVNKYKLNFSPDIIYGNAGYNTFYGVTGSTVMAFSDLLGNHQIVFVTNLLLDLKNSDYALQYLYLPERIDYGFTAFHSARFVIINDVFGGSLYRFRTYGVSLNAQYPIDRFRRFDAGLSWFNISRENLDQIADPTQKRTTLVPSIGYTHDNSLWGFTGPINGTRYSFNVFGTPKLGSAGLSFVNVTGDYRTYLRLGRQYNIALRLAGGGSFGRNPQKFIIGGVDNWINRTFEGGYIPLENAEDYIFLQTGLPLRGYNFNAGIGSRYGLFNFEFRYPLFAFLQAGPLPIGLQSINGAIFFDMGAAWNRENEFKAFTKDARGYTVTRDLLMGMGTGTRIYFLGFLVKLDVAWAWYWSGFSEPKYYLSLGTDF